VAILRLRRGRFDGNYDRAAPPRPRCAGGTVCAYLSAALLIGLLGNAALGWWWTDPLVALGIAAIALREGRQAWRGEACCCCA
jgi:hypothetical protein